MEKTWEIVGGAEKSVLDQSSGIFQLFLLPRAMAKNNLISQYYALSGKYSFDPKHMVSYHFSSD